MARSRFLVRAALLVSSFAGPAIAQEKVIVQVGVPTPSISFLDLYVAQRENFFRDESLDVDVRLTSGGPLAIQLAASGGADVAGVTFEPFLAGYDKGIRGKYIFQKYQQLIYYIAVPADSSVNSIRDLAGRRIGVANMASVSIAVAKSALRKVGIDPSPAMFVPVGLGDTAILALKRGDVQALSIWDSAYPAIERSGLKLKFLKHPEIGNIGNGGYFASEQTIKARHGVLVRFVRAVIRAHSFIRANPKAAVEDYWSANPSARVGSSANEQMDYAISEMKVMGAFAGAPDDVSALGAFDRTGVMKYMAIMKEEGVSANAVGVDEMLTNEFVEEAKIAKGALPNSRPQSTAK